MSDLATQMEQTFGLPPCRWACPVMAAIGWLVLDPSFLERALEQRLQTEVPEGESLRDFVGRHYGADAVALVERGMKGERR